MEFYSTFYMVQKGGCQVLLDISNGREFGAVDFYWTLYMV